MSLLDDVSIVVTPNGYKAGELYAVIPVPVYGAEEVTNGGFTTDISDWYSGASASLSWDSSLLGISNNSTSYNSYAYQEFTLVVGKVYIFTADIVSDSQGSGGTKRIWVTEGASDATVLGSTLTTGVGSYSVQFTATGATRIRLGKGSNSGVTVYDNASVKEALTVSADMDVTRATAATRVDENGLVNYAEVIGGEEVTCGDFSCAVPLDVWTAQAGWTISGNSANSDGLSNYSNIYQTISPNLVVGNTYTVSFNLTVTSGALRIRTSSGTYYSNVFNISGNQNVILTLTNGNDFWFNSFSGFKGSISNISVKEVTRDNVPRIDYTGGGCPHILAEPQRTNLITYSEDFTDSSWSSDPSNAHITRVANAATSPSGENNATKLIGNNTTRNPSNAYIFATTTSGTPFVSSVFAKKGEYDYLIMSIGSYAGGYWSSFNLDNGTVDTQPTQADTTASIEDYGNGWYRCIITTTTAASSEICLVTPCVDGNLTTQYINTTNGIYVYGADLQEGSYPTSYIPTSGSTVTRNQDIFTRDGIGSLINSTEGVLFVEMARQEGDALAGVITLNNGTASQAVALYYFSTGSIAFDVISSSPTVSGSSSPYNTYNFNKIALKYKSGDIALWVNGVEVATSANAISLTGLNKISFDYGGGSLPFYGKVRQLQVYDTALTDEQLLQLTGESGTDFYESYAEMASALTYTIQ